MFDLLKPYIMILKMWGLIGILVAAGGYVGWLHYRIADLEGRIASREEALKICDTDRSRLRGINRVQQHNLDALDEYYRTRRCLQLHDGILSDEEMDLK